ncbi:oxidoreductase [Weissella paramesenteroides]|uniref:NAD(P)H-binding protein n=1 Tax=Weissella paramesenteroides TaxID=1249 RepID=UPI0012397D34|nr:NAD(P)H-binding protein [Weissella paramesenteroides]KAA8441050.1 oxidoreductase [Weissella paramesenteroides]KAA8441172.1 oxidoreductase [Weissella paramesenteroides]KAA8443482.1 oxidoreductase [Weissella paramesenteroides]KAA8447770.1 oxidoreductase [Weissella paramesenteroides]KAA8449627.1 oxidoreductase [Weissella paramesenteroides]
MTKNVLIMAANGQISRLVVARLLSEPEFSDVALTLFVRQSTQVADLQDDTRVSVFEGSLDNSSDVTAAMAGQNMAFVGVVDHSKDNLHTKNVIAGMKQAGVQRVIYANVLGIYDEVPGEFGTWNRATIGSGLPTAEKSDRLLAESGLDYTTLRIPWLNNREVEYVITHKDEPYVGVSGSRKSIADVIVRVIADFDFLKNDSVRIADPETDGETRPVY